MERDPQILKALLDNVPSPIFFKGIDGRYMGCNLAFEKYLGRAKEEIVGKTVFDISPRELAERYKQQDDELFAHPGVQEYEAKVKYVDGSLHDVIFHKATFNDENGRVAGQVGVILDISNRKQAEIELQDSEKRYHEIFNSLYNIFYRVALDGTLQIISPSVYDRAGYRPEELIGRNVMEIYADPAERAELVARIGRQGTVNDYEIQLRTKGGDIRQASLSSRMVLDDGGKPVAIDGIIRDITEQKLAEGALKESEERFRKLVDDLPEYVFVYRGKTIQYVNRTALRVLGYAMEQVSSKTMFDFVVERDHAIVAENMGKRATGQPVPRYEIHIIDAQGNEHCVVANADPIMYEDQPAMLAVLYDITVQKEIDRSLQESEQKYRMLVEHQGEGIVIADFDELITYSNPAAEGIFGVPAGTLAGRHITEFITIEAAELLARETGKRRMNEQSKYELEIIRPTGERRTLLVTAVPQLDASGRAAGTQAILQDVTEQKRTQEVLLVSEEKYRTLFANMLNGFSYNRIIADETGRPVDFEFLEINDAFERMMGMTRGDIIGKRAYTLMPGMKNDPFDWLGAFGRVALNGQELKIEQFFEPLGKWFSIAVYSPARGFFVMVFDDITERKRAETELMQHNDTQSALAALLHFALEDISFAKLLDNTIDLILSIPWLSLESRGSIFLVEEDPGILVMKSQRNLAEPIQKACARIPFGKCHCGRAALSKQIEFADCLGERHEISYDGIKPHGHYCVPIISAGNVLGVLNLYVQEGHQQSKSEEVFLTSISDALAGIIQRKRIEEELRKMRFAVEQSANIIVITDLDANIVYVNQSFVDLTGYSHEEAIGNNPRILKSGEMSQADYVQMWQLLQSGGKWQGEFHNKKKNGNLYWEQATITMLRDEQGKPAFYMAIKEDITMRRVLEEERERLISELQDSLDNIKTLKGLVPICSSCKKIRDDKGYWQQVEVYVAKHTEADFSHGLCDECAHKLYPEYFAEKKNLE